MASVWGELKRRNVVKVAVAYGVVGWLLVEIGATVLPIFEAPPWTVPVFTFLVILGFPVALILSWAYELTPEGLQRDPSDVKDVPPRPNSKLAAVAVLPFKKLTASNADDFLAEAIPLELHNSLSRVYQLRVVSSQSALAHSQASKDLKSIAHDLDVKYVICGSIAQFGTTIRVIAELYDAVADALLWSKDFEMVAGRAFEIQQQIAEAVAVAFGGERLRHEVEQARSSAPTELAAWELVQKARSYLLNYSTEAVAEAIPLLEQAVKLDESYAVGHAHLGLVTAEKTLNAIGDDPAADRASAIEAMDRAVNLGPTNPMVLRSAGVVHAYCGNNVKSIELLRRAVAISPHDLGGWGYFGWPLVATGQTDHLSELHEILDRLLDMGTKHPGHPYWLFHKSVAYACEDECEQALPYARQFTAAQPQFALGWMNRANVNGRLGRFDASRKNIERCMATNTRMSTRYYCELISVLSDTKDVINRRTSGLRQIELHGGDQ